MFSSLWLASAPSAGAQATTAPATGSLTGVTFSNLTSRVSAERSAVTLEAFGTSAGTVRGNATFVTVGVRANGTPSGGVSIWQNGTTPNLTWLPRAGTGYGFQAVASGGSVWLLGGLDALYEINGSSLTVANLTAAYAKAMGTPIAVASIAWDAGRFYLLGWDPNSLSSFAGPYYTLFAFNPGRGTFSNLTGALPVSFRIPSAGVAYPGLPIIPIDPAEIQGTPWGLMLAYISSSGPRVGLFYPNGTLRQDYSSRFPAQLQTGWYVAQHFGSVFGAAYWPYSSEFLAHNATTVFLVGTGTSYYSYLYAIHPVSNTVTNLTGAYLKTGWYPDIVRCSDSRLFIAGVKLIHGVLSPLLLGLPFATGRLHDLSGFLPPSFYAVESLAPYGGRVFVTGGIASTTGGILDGLLVL